MSDRGCPAEKRCAESHYATVVEPQKAVEIYQLGAVACANCLACMADKHAVLAEIFRARLNALSSRAAKDFSCHAEDREQAPRALCHECSEMVEIADGKLAAHHGMSGEGCPLNNAPVQIYLHPRVADRIAQLEASLVFGGL